MKTTQYQSDYSVNETIKRIEEISRKSGDRALQTFHHDQEDFDIVVEEKRGDSLKMYAGINRKTLRLDVKLEPAQHGCLVTVDSKAGTVPGGYWVVLGLSVALFAVAVILGITMKMFVFPLVPVVGIVISLVVISKYYNTCDRYVDTVFRDMICKKSAKERSGSDHSSVSQDREPAAGEWKCPACGRINQNYVGTCGCGRAKE